MGTAETDCMKALGDRIKRYEAVNRYVATVRTPLMIRVDGRAFHTFTRGMDRPFDQRLTNAIVGAAKATAIEMQGFKVGYVQSDEATFCITDYDKLDSQGWFGYELPKIISISAALMTAHFNRLLPTEKTPVFDSRAFSIPAHDVTNAFLWRVKDWEKNSLQMYARTFFSQEQLHGKNRQAMHDMLHGVGKNWATDLTEQQKNGTFIIATNDGLIERHDILPTFDSINDIIGSAFLYP